ncbi:MAG: VCBS repeat-containing protein [Eubacterium sp.]|nr:VCBS repeat-containing protein [Eubacterium sp.]
MAVLVRSVGLVCMIALLAGSCPVGVYAVAGGNGLKGEGLSMLAESGRFVVAAGVDSLDNRAADSEDEIAQRQLLADYEDYQARLYAVERQREIGEYGFSVIEDQIFPIETAGYGSVYLVPAMEEKYHRLALFFTKEDGTVVYRTDQLAANSWNIGSLEQPIRAISAVSFQDLNRDGRMDIILIVDCRNKTGAYSGKSYKVGDVLFQDSEGFYDDYRVSDKINRFGMNKSAESIIAYVRDGYSTEFLYTASTKRELLKNGFVITAEQDYSRQFEKLGYLEVMPGTYTMAEFTTFMIYLVNEQGEIVWSFQPMGDFDNLYALKGIACRDIDGDGMKDLLVLARYSYAGNDNEVVVRNDYAIYYQRTSGFETDTEVKKKVICSEEDTVAELVEKARAYWGWSPET